MGCAGAHPGAARTKPAENKGFQPSISWCHSIHPHHGDCDSTSGMGSTRMGSDRLRCCTSVRSITTSRGARNPRRTWLPLIPNTTTVMLEPIAMDSSGRRLSTSMVFLLKAPKAMEDNYPTRGLAASGSHLHCGGNRRAPEGDMRTVEGDMCTVAVIANRRRLHMSRSNAAIFKGFTNWP